MYNFTLIFDIYMPINKHVSLFAGSVRKRGKLVVIRKRFSGYLVMVSLISFE